MPADRFLHPRVGRDARVTQLNDLEARVWAQGYLLCADDYGVMRASALPIQELNDALATRPTRVIERCLARLVDVGLLLSFQFQGREYLCQADWQDQQHIRWPRETLNPVPPGDILARCSNLTQELFRVGAEKRTKTPPDASGGVAETIPQASGSTSEVSPEHSGSVTETLPSLPRAGAREVANGYRLQATGKRLTARRENAHGTGDELRERFDAFWTLYPKKVGKDAAWRAWEKRRPDAALSAQVVTALTWQRRQDSWLREGGRFVPNPATWITQGRWNDEPSATPRLNDRTLAIGRAGEQFLKTP